MMTEKFDPVTRTRQRGPVRPEDADPPGFGGIHSRKRDRVLTHQLKRLRRKLCSCCETATEALAAAQDYGGVAMLIGGVTGDLNQTPPGGPLSWSDHILHPDYHFDAEADSGLTVNVSGLFRIYTLITYNSAAADTSIAVYIDRNATALPGIGRHGYIAGPLAGHQDSSSSIETWAELEDGDFIEPIVMRNGAAGSVAWKVSESLFVMQRVKQ